MTETELHNESTRWLVLWLEPIGEDRWLKPGETFRIRSDYTGDEVEFSFHFRGEESVEKAFFSCVTVWVHNGNPCAEIIDQDGNAVECGHQRPVEIARKWEADAAASKKRFEERSS